MDVDRLISEARFGSNRKVTELVVHGQKVTFTEVIPDEL